MPGYYGASPYACNFKILFIVHLKLLPINQISDGARFEFASATNASQLHLVVAKPFHCYLRVQNSKLAKAWRDDTQYPLRLMDLHKLSRSISSLSLHLHTVPNSADLHGSHPANSNYLIVIE